MPKVTMPKVTVDSELRKTRRLKQVHKARRKVSGDARVVLSTDDERALIWLRMLVASVVELDPSRDRARALLDRLLAAFKP